MAPIIRINSSSRSGACSSTESAPKVSLSCFRLVRIRRVSWSLACEGKKNLLILKTETKPWHSLSSFRIGNVRMLCWSMMANASHALVSSETRITLCCMTSLTFGRTSATNRGGATPNFRNTKSIRSLMSPHLAGITFCMPIFCLKSA